MEKYDLMRYMSNSVIGFGLLSIVDQYTYGDKKYTIRDAGSFAMSILASNFIFDIIQGYLPINSRLLLYLLKSLITGLVYSLVYEKFINNKYGGLKDMNTDFFIGFILSILIGFIENPLLGIFGLHVYE